MLGIREGLIIDFSPHKPQTRHSGNLEEREPPSGEGFLGREGFAFFVVD